MTDQQRRQINEGIARAMGWTRTADEPNYGYEWRDETGMLQYSLPDFTRDAAASRSLVEWLAADRSRFDAFAWKFGTCLRPGTYWPDRLRDVMTTPLETIAQAAFQAIGGKLDE